MPELMNLLETMRAEEASFERLFGDLFGYQRVSEADRELHESKVDALHEIYLDALDGNRRARFRFEEAMTSSDFPLLFGDIIDRVLLAGYAEVPTSYQEYMNVNRQVKDFRKVSRFTMDGAQGLLPTVGQLEEYPAVGLKEGRYQYQVWKHGNRLPFSWETLVNDDLGAFNDIPLRFGRQCRRSVENFAASLFMDANGPHASMYKAANKNIVNKANGCTNDNPPIGTIDDLNDAIALLGSKKDADGQPIETAAVHLVVATKAQEIKANQLVNATEYRMVSGGNTVIVSGNGLSVDLKVHRNPYIPFIATAANGSTSWALFADPNLARPALEIGFLRGRDVPEIFMKAPNAMRVGGGGQIDPTDGDFDTDSIQHKVRFCFGGGQMDPIPTVASNGSGLP